MGLREDQWVSLSSLSLPFVFQTSVKSPTPNTSHGGTRS